MKLVNLVGARPQFVKAAVVSKAIDRFPEIDQILVHSGQHYDDAMSKIFFTEMEIPRPHHNLGISEGGHGDQTGRMLIAIEKLLMELRPDGVLVYGDTNTTLAGALAAAKLHIPVFHIEAGLRSFDRRMPEEINRVVVDHLSCQMFAPTVTAVNNLEREGISVGIVHNVGDVMYDAALLYSSRADSKSKILASLEAHARDYVLLTIHRAENTDNPEKLAVICETLNRLTRRIAVIFPAHPRTLKALGQARLLAKLDAVRIINPVGYLDMVMLEKNARLIITDSGGVQKEAFFYRVPCVTFRDTTEWVELVELGWNRLAPPTSVDEQLGAIEASFNALPITDLQPYGTGKAAAQIAEILSQCAAASLDKNINYV